jgi:hypothetical protein
MQDERQEKESKMWKRVLTTLEGPGVPPALPSGSCIAARDLRQPFGGLEAPDESI